MNFYINLRNSHYIHCPIENFQNSKSLLLCLSYQKYSKLKAGAHEACINNCLSASQGQAGKIERVLSFKSSKPARKTASSDVISIPTDLQIANQHPKNKQRKKASCGVGLRLDNIGQKEYIKLLVEIGHERFFVVCDFLKNGPNDFFLICVLINCPKSCQSCIHFNPIEIKEEGVNQECLKIESVSITNLVFTRFILA